ncbi:MAG: hypothetical protein LBN30_00850 [Oscillospiraceae bacterium]|nr:hypothetical protein [Oscillospiraceae bacterium]
MTGKWTTLERREEIVRLLESGRLETVASLARYFGASPRTISYDLDSLTPFHPLEVTRGNGGGVRLGKRDGTYRNDITVEQQETLLELIATLDKAQAVPLKELLIVHGSIRNKERIERSLEQ